MVYKINYKNTTFGNTYVGYTPSPIRKEDIHTYVFSNFHRYCGNHAIGHGKYEVIAELFTDYPSEYLIEAKDKIEREIWLLKNKLKPLEERLHEFTKAAPGTKIEYEDIKVSGGDISSKEEVLRDYCNGDEEEFNLMYSKYYK